MQMELRSKAERVQALEEFVEQQRTEIQTLNQVRWAGPCCRGAHDGGCTHELWTGLWNGLCRLCEALDCVDCMHGVDCRGRQVFTSGGGGGSIEPPKTGAGGYGKRAQLTDTIITIAKKLRSRFWQGLCTSDFVLLLGSPRTAGVMYPIYPFVGLHIDSTFQRY